MAALTLCCVPLSDACACSTDAFVRRTSLDEVVLVSGTFRSDQGSPLAANYVVTSAEAAKTLGRPLSGNAPSVTVNLLKPGEMWGDRVNEVDLKVAKSVKAMDGSDVPVRMEAAVGYFDDKQIGRADVACTNGMIHFLD